MQQPVCARYFLPAFEKTIFKNRMDSTTLNVKLEQQSFINVMYCIKQLIAECCRWKQCTVGQILSYAQQLAWDYFLFLQIITANVLRDNNMVYKTCCKAVGVSISSAHKPTLYKRTETTFTLRRFHSCHPNRLSGTICTPL